MEEGKDNGVPPSKAKTPPVKITADKKTAASPKVAKKRPLPDPSPLVPHISRHLGLLVMLVLGSKWATYLATLHENQFWFSNIREVEREISFRTENGLYYSYFKHLVKAPSLWEGYNQLKEDNLTEHGSNINIFGRFNVYQELIVAVMYKVYSFGMTPIIFYVNTVFSLQGLYLAVKFMLAWHLSGSWLAGVLSSVYVVCHRQDVTRVINSLALREQFSMPFVFAQFLAVGKYLESPKKTKTDLALIFSTSFVFNLTWQFGPIVLLLQSIVIFYLAVIEILERNVVCKLMLTNLLSLLCVWSMQFYQSFIVSSLFVSYVPIACLILQGLDNIQAPAHTNEEKSANGDAKYKTSLKKLGQSFIILFVALFATLLLNQALKQSLGHDADNHILDFVYDKLGVNKDETNFETRLYLCLSAFQGAGLEYLGMLTQRTHAPLLYAFMALSTVAAVAATALARWFGHTKIDHKVDSWLRWIDSKPSINFVLRMDQRPTLAFHIAQSLIFGVLGLTTQRMMIFWTPYVCVFAACAVANDDLWNFVLPGKPTRHMLALFGI